MKHVLDPDGLAIDLAAAPLAIEHMSIAPAKKRVDLLSSPRKDGAMPFGKAPADAMTLTYRVRVDEQATMDEALAILRELSQLLDEAENQLPAGMPLDITPDGSVEVSTAYVLLGEVSELPQEMSGQDIGWYHNSPVATITLLCDSFYEGPEEAAGEVEGEGPVLELEVAEVKGDVDARALAVVTDAAGVAKRHYELGLESRYYDPESPAPVLIEGSDFEVEGLNGEVVEAPAGAHSTKVVETVLGSSPVTVCSTGAQLHIGQWREKLRFQGSSTDVYVRLAWRVGDGSWGRGEWVQVSEADEWLERFLDTINVPQASVGGQRWEGRIEAYSSAAAGGDTIKVDYLENIPAERWIQVRAPDLPETPAEIASKTPGTVVSSEEGTGAGRTAWTNPANAKLSDASFATMTLASGAFGQLLKATDFGFVLDEEASIGDIGVVVEGHISTATSVVQAGLRIVKGGASGTDYIQAWPLTTGEVLLTEDGLFDETWTAADINAAGFGASLQVQNFGPDAVTVSINRIAISVYWTTAPETPFICAASRELRIDDQAAERYDETGTYLAPVPEHRGGNLYLPPSGARGRRVRLVSKLRTNDVDSEADDLASAGHSLAVTYRPRYRFLRSS